MRWRNTRPSTAHWCIQDARYQRQQYGQERPERKWGCFVTVRQTSSLQLWKLLCVLLLSRKTIHFNMKKFRFCKCYYYCFFNINNSIAVAQRDTLLLSITHWFHFQHKTQSSSESLYISVAWLVQYIIEIQYILVNNIVLLQVTLFCIN